MVDCYLDCCLDFSSLKIQLRDLFLYKVYFFGSSVSFLVPFGGLSFGALFFFCIVQLESLWSLHPSFSVSWLRHESWGGVSM